MKRLLWIIPGIVIGLPIVAFVVGSFLPKDHVVQMTIDFAAPPAKVWALVSDFSGTPKWRRDVTSVRVEAAGPGGAFRFTELSSNGEVPFEVVSQDPPRRQVVRVVDDDQPFGGTWVWVLEPRGSGTQLTIIEAGFIKSAIFRAMGALFFSPADTLTDYMRALSWALGETSEPREG